MNKTTYYINGNAVRELDEAAPVRRPQKSTRELRGNKKKEKQKEHLQEEIRREHSQ